MKTERWQAFRQINYLKFINEFLEASQVLCSLVMSFGSHVYNSNA